MTGRPTARRPAGATGSTLVVVPSISFPAEELRKITAVVSYEERMLFAVLLLADPEMRMVFVTSQPVDPATVEYYLRFLPDPDGARRRLRLLDAGDGSVGSLSEKLLARPPLLDKLREMAGHPAAGEGGLLPFNVTRAEGALAEALGLSLYGPRPDLVWLGSKSGARRVAAEAGVRLLPGVEDVFSGAELAKAIAGLREGFPETEAVVVKLNNGFSGQGNAIVELDGLRHPLSASDTVFCAEGESWGSFEPKIEAEGAIVETLVRREGLRSPSVQLQISPEGEVQVLSTHDQILGGPQNQVYLGCRFPAQEEYRLAIQAAARKVGDVLAARGVTGAFGIDFLVDRTRPHDGVSLSEINLRMGGTTHPYWMALLASGATYDEAAGEMRLPGGPARCYLATDNLKSERLVGSTPSEVIARIDRAGLAFDSSTATGATLHLLGALPTAGKMGVTCIAATSDDADALYREVLAVLDAR